MTRGKKVGRRLAVAGVATAVVAVAAGCSASTGAGGGTSSASSAAGPASSRPSTGPAGTVWVSNEDGNSLTAIDAASSTVAATVNGVAMPHNVQATPDGSTVLAVSVGSGAVVSLDPARYSVRATAQTDAHPAHVIASPDGQRAYVTSGAANAVDVYQLPSLKRVTAVRVGAGPHGLRPSPDGTKVVVADAKADTVDVIDTRTLASSRITVGANPVQVAVSPDSRFAYVSLGTPKKVVKVDLAARKVVASASVPDAPVQVYVSADGKRLLAADQGTEQKPGHDVSVIDPQTMAVTATIPVGAGPHGVVIDPSGTRAWVTNTFADTVSAIDLTSNTVAATIPVGKAPNGISFGTTPPIKAGSVGVEIPTYPTGDMEGMAGMSSNPSPAASHT